MTWARLCEHGRFEPHDWMTPANWPRVATTLINCPGGSVLPDDTLVIVKEGAANRLHAVLRMWNYDLNDYSIIKCAEEVLESLAAAQGSQE